MPDVEQADLTALTVQLLSAYVSNNTVPSEQLASLIETTRTALGAKTEPTPEPTPEYQPAVTVRKSLGSKDHILSLIDGKPYKTLKRHLANHGLTPAEYRERYGLPKSYPMVAPTYSEARREVAHRLGLGQRGAARRAQLAAEASAPVEPIAAAPTKAPRVVKPKNAPKRTTKAAKAGAPEATPVIEAPAAAANVETPSNPPRAKAKAAAKPATAKRTRAKAAPVESAPAAETAVAEIPSEKPASKPRAQKPTAEAAAKAAAPKRARKAPAVEAAPTEVVETKPKRARQPKAAEPAA